METFERSQRIRNSQLIAVTLCTLLLAQAGSITTGQNAEATAPGGRTTEFQINSTATTASGRSVGSGSYSIEKTGQTIRFTNYSTRGMPKEPAPLYLVFSYISCPILGMDLFRSGKDVGDSWSHESEKNGRAEVELIGGMTGHVPAGKFEDCILHRTTYTGLIGKSDEATAFLNGKRSLIFARGVGLVMMSYEHSDGTKTQTILTQYNVPDSSGDYLPLKIGNSWTYRWKNDYRGQYVIEKCEVVAPETEVSEPEEPDRHPAVMVRGQEKLELNDAVLAEVAADPGKGFNYPYFLHIPANVERERAVHILVETNNTGTTSDDVDFHRRRAKRLAAESYAFNLAKSLSVPLLVPTFPRPKSQWQAYTHSLDEDTLLIKDGPLKRIDLQLVAMIADGRSILERSGLKVKEKVFMHGFSASGTFTNRFPILHPEIVQAVASGGVNGIPTFVTGTWKGNELPYPVGIADLTEITGIKFNRDAYNKVRQYVYMGSFDRNDTTMSRDCFSQEHVDLIWSLIGKPMDKRWETSKSIYRELGVSAQLVTYRGVSHEIRREMLDDVVKFFKANSGDSFVEIEAHEYPEVVYRQIEHAHIDGLYWGGDERLPERKRELPEGVSFVISIAEWIDGQDHRQLGEFRDNAGFDFVLKAEGCKGIVIGRENYWGTMTSISPTVRFKVFAVKLTPEQLEGMVRGRKYTIVPRNESTEHTWLVNDGVALVRP
ncbi:MAG: hypothetical protein ACYTE3_09515 [Planctomycetota bacterium]|jgi:hypothetical protein